MEREQSENDSIILRNGDIFESGCEVLVNPVNCIGTMGKGLALEFKSRYRDNYNFYQRYCAKKLLKPGMVLAFETSYGAKEWPIWILNMATKDHWKDKSELGFIHAGLMAMAGFIDKKKPKSIAIPAIGCGLDGLPWDEVKKAIIEIFSFMPETKCIIYEPMEKK